MNRNEVIKKLEDKQKKYSSKRMEAVFDYAIELIEERYDIENFERENLKRVLLNGANNFLEYSISGNSLIYDDDILRRLPKSYKKIRNNGTALLEVQAKYLQDAFCKIMEIVSKD